MPHPDVSPSAVAVPELRVIQLPQLHTYMGRRKGRGGARGGGRGIRYSGRHQPSARGVLLAYPDVGSRAVAVFKVGIVQLAQLQRGTET